MTQNNLGNALSVLGERDGETRAPGRGRRDLSARPRGTDPRAGPARLGDDAEQSRYCAFSARPTRRRDRAPGRCRCAYRLALEEQTREAGPARLGDDAEQSR